MKTRSEAAANLRFPEFIRLGLVALLLGALVACGFFNMLQPREPRYRGKPISLWISVYQNQFSLAAPTSEAGEVVKMRIQDARKAISSFGPAALPYLTSAMDHGETPLLRPRRESHGCWGHSDRKRALPRMS